MKSLATLLPKVRLATEKNKLPWLRRGISYATSVGDFEIQTWQWTERDDEISGVTIQLLSSENTVLDELVSNEFGANYSELRDFFGVARRAALGVDDVIKGLEKTLDKL